MKTRTALIAILLVGIFGLTFSGFLSYKELWGTSALQCPSPGKAGTILGYPACIYGFFMYLLIIIIALLGLFSKNETKSL